MLTSTDYSPHSLLPAPEPSTDSPPDDYFYQHVAKHLIRDTVRLQQNGLNIDMDRVIELEATLDTQLADVETRIASNPLVQTYLESRYKSQIAEYQEKQASKFKQPSDFIKPFKYNDMAHRSYFMHVYATQQGISLPSDTLPTGVSKWPANTVKKLAKTRPVLTKLLSGQLTDTHPTVIKSMELWAQHKADLHNRSYREKISNPTIDYPKFNPASSLQKREFFDLLSIQSEATSATTGDPKWDRDQVTRINAETTDPDLLDFTQALIDHSFAAIVRNNFINAFYTYTVEGRLYGQYKLLGAKSARFTSSNPNMLNMPSTGSIFAKPIKRCFTAPPGFLIATADYAALEDRVIASLSRDPNKCAIFTEGVDGHSLGACAYFPVEVAKEMPVTGNTIADAKLFKSAVDAGNKALKDLRQKGKGVTFGLSYGAYPPKVAATLKCPLKTAEQIFSNYHNILYPGITDYRENYVLPTTQVEGKLHLGLGFYISTDDPDRDIRTNHNASCQFWSILTALTINKMHHLIDDAGYADDIIITSTIYDSIYFEVRNDVTIVKWLNDTLIPIMTTDFMQDQTIHNEANLEIGLDWADLTELPNDCSLDHISQVIKDI